MWQRKMMLRKMGSNVLVEEGEVKGDEEEE